LRPNGPGSPVFLGLALLQANVGRMERKRGLP
jgi:hypothetical protein